MPSHLTHLTGLWPPFASGGPSGPSVPSGRVGAPPWGWVELLLFRGSAPQPVPRDDRALIAAAGLLEATGKFEATVLGTGGDGTETPVPADAANHVTLWLGRWQNNDDDAGYDGGAVSVKHVREFFVALTVRQGGDDDAPRRRENRLSRLESVILNTLNGSDLGGNAIPFWTRIQVSQPGDPRNPESGSTMTGRFGYFVGAVDGFDDADDEPAF